jgi:hypothetical protein
MIAPSPCNPIGLRAVLEIVAVYGLAVVALVVAARWL